MSTKTDNADCLTVSSTSSSVPDDKDPDVVTQKTSTSATEVPAVATTVGPEKCVASGCNNVPITHPEWDHEYCSIKCCYNHCRGAFENWLVNNKILKAKASKVVSSSQTSLPATVQDETETKS